MSRGWESKSVEGQQQEAQQTMAENFESRTASGNVMSDADRLRRRQALELQRERVLSERTSSPHRRSALEGALASIEEELAQLGWTVHL